jgi:hypothetical protein
MAENQKNKNKINHNLNTLETKAVGYFQELRRQKQNLMTNKETVEKVKDYIFGEGENPFEEINKEYNKKVDNLRERYQGVAQRERQNYMGKKKKGVNFVRSIKPEDIGAI